MSDVEEIVISDIVNIISENLKLQMTRNNPILMNIKEFCNIYENNETKLSYEEIIYLTNIALKALLCANYLYDFRDIE